MTLNSSPIHPLSTSFNIQYFFFLTSSFRRITTTFNVFRIISLLQYTFLSIKDSTKKLQCQLPPRHTFQLYPSTPIKQLYPPISIPIPHPTYPKVSISKSLLSNSFIRQDIRHFSKNIAVHVTSLASLFRARRALLPSPLLFPSSARMPRFS